MPALFSLALTTAAMQSLSKNLRDNPLHSLKQVPIDPADYQLFAMAF